MRQISLDQPCSVNWNGLANNLWYCCYLLGQKYENGQRKELGRTEKSVCGRMCMPLWGVCTYVHTNRRRQTECNSLNESAKVLQGSSMESHCDQLGAQLEKIRRLLAGWQHNKEAETNASNSETIQKRYMKMEEGNKNSKKESTTENQGKTYKQRSPKKKKKLTAMQICCFAMHHATFKHILRHNVYSQVWWHKHGTHLV